MNNSSDNKSKTKEIVVLLNKDGKKVCLGSEHRFSLQNNVDNSLGIEKGKEVFVAFQIEEKYSQEEKEMNDLYDKAKKQKEELIKKREKGETIPLVIEKAATDEHPVADLKSDVFTNWRFQLSRRLCVKGFLHKQKVGTRLELYIDGFGEDQSVYVSYIKKDHLSLEEREKIINELREKIKEGKDVNEQIDNYLKEKPLKVKINTVLDDHIIVEYNKLYGTMTASDLFHSKSSEGMEHYRKLQREDGTMKVYVNTIDSTGNVTFSETRLPELYNNPGYINKEKGQSKWINDIKHFEGLEIGQIIKCIIWHYSKNGLYVIFKNNGGYVQSLIPNTALTEHDIYKWADEHPVNSETDLRIVKIDKEQKRIILFPKDVTTPKYPQQVELEKRTTANVNETEINEGQRVEVEIVCESKVDQDILYARCGGYRGVINVNEDLPDCLRHESGKDEKGRAKRTFISYLITLNGDSKSTILLPAIAHIKGDGDNKTYNFSVIDACSRCIEQLEEEELVPGYREAEVVMSRLNEISNERYTILRWHDLYTFFHLESKEVQELNYKGDWEAGSKLTIWVNGIDQDLSFDAEPTNPRTHWKSINFKTGDYLFIDKTWLSRMGIYRTKIEGCTGTILPGFKLDEEQIDYPLKVVLLKKDEQILILSNESHQLVSSSDIEEETREKKENKRELHLLMPLYKNLFLAEDKKSKKWAIIQTTPSAYAFLCAIYNNFKIGTFVRLSENNETHFNYRNYIFPCSFKKDGDTVLFEWKGEVRSPIKEDKDKIVNFEEILLKKEFKKASWWNNLSYDFTCKTFIQCKITEEERNQIQDKILSGKLKQPVFFTGKILYSNHAIYPLFSFKDPNIIRATVNETFDCRIVLYDENTNNYIVEFETQKGLIKCREKKELRFLPNEIIKGIYKGQIDEISHMPCLELLELTSKKKLEYNRTYEAIVVGRKTDGVILYLKDYNKRIFLPNKKLFVTKKQYDLELPSTMNVRYKGGDFFELTSPLSIESRPPSGDNKYNITILSKNEKDYDVYIEGGKYDGIMGVLPAKNVDFKSINNTANQLLSPGAVIKNAQIVEEDESNDIIFNIQNSRPYSEQFRKGKWKKGKVISEEKDKYLISFDDVYGYTNKDKNLSVGRSYDFSIMEYVLGSRGPKLIINGNFVAYRVLLKVKLRLKTGKKKQILAHVVGYDEEKIYLEAGIYNLYARLDNDEISELFINRFGKIEIHIGTNVYVVPVDYNVDSLHNDAEARIVKIKK